MLPLYLPTVLIGKPCRGRSNVLNSTNQESQMKLNIRKAIWIFALAVAVTAFVTPKVAASQSQQDQRSNKANRNNNANNLMYQQRLHHVQAEPANNQAH